MVDANNNGPGAGRSPALALASALEYHARATHKLLVLLERSPGGPEGGVVIGAAEDGELVDEPASSFERALPTPEPEEAPPVYEEPAPTATAAPPAPDPMTDPDAPQHLPPPGPENSIQGAVRPEGHYTLSEAAEILDIAVSSLRYRVRNGHLRATALKGYSAKRHVYFLSPEDIKRELARIPYQRYKAPRKAASASDGSSSDGASPPEGSDLLSTAEAAKILGLTPAGVLRRIERGALPATMTSPAGTSRPQYYIRREDLAAQAPPRETGWRASRKDPKAEAAKRKKKNEDESIAHDLQRLTSKLDSVTRDIENVEALAGRMGETEGQEGVTS